MMSVSLIRSLRSAVFQTRFTDGSSLATLPLGGSKSSGWGRNNAKWGLEEFSVLKLVTVSMEPGLSKFR